MYINIIYIGPYLPMQLIPLFMLLCSLHGCIQEKVLHQSNFVFRRKLMSYSIESLKTTTKYLKTEIVELCTAMPRLLFFSQKIRLENHIIVKQ